MWINAIAAAIVCGAILYDVVNNTERKKPCDMCKNLKYKGGIGAWKYRCAINGKFDVAPKYCCDFRPREDSEKEKS